MVVKCQSKKEMEQALVPLKSDTDLEVEVAKNKEPLVILKNVLTSNSDDGILTAIKSQNTH